MKRIQAFEFNERPEVPRFIRDSIVETLGAGLRWGRIYEVAAPLFGRFVQEAGARSVLDLCSGSGEPVSILLEGLARRGIEAPHFVISDLFPNETAMADVAARHPGLVTPVNTSVDATAVPPEHDQPARTVVSAFHHFPPDLARAILADSVAKGRAIFILEGFPRSLRRLLAVIPAMAVSIFVNPLRTKRERFAKAFFTYVVPVVPAAGIWDACVSALRVHSEQELRAMVAPLGAGYRWEYHEVSFTPGGRAVVFFGVPPRA